MIVTAWLWSFLKVNQIGPYLSKNLSPVAAGGNLYDQFTIVKNSAHCRVRDQGPLPLQSGWIL